MSESSVFFVGMDVHKDSITFDVLTEISPSPVLQVRKSSTHKAVDEILDKLYGQGTVYACYGAGINSSVGSAGDSSDNALAESVIGLFKTEVIRRKGPWKSLESVEYATLEWVDWFNNRRLLEPMGNIPPVELESAYYAIEETPVLVAGLT